MKKYIVIAVLSVSAGVFAQQQDSLLRRQMELERDFNPTLQDANKITSLPALHEPIVQRAKTAYSTWAGRTAPPLEIALPRPGTIMTEIPFSKKKGYIVLNAGNYANIDGTLGYRLLETDKNSLSFDFLHNSTNGDVNYVQDSDPKSNKAYVMDNLARLKYNHLLDVFKLNIHASYLHSLFNYYGNTLGDTRTFNNENQRVGIANIHVGLESDKSDFLLSRGYLDFKNFSSRFGKSITADGIKGNQIDAMAGFAKPFQGGDSKVGVDGRLFGAFYGGDIDRYLLVGASPYVSFEGLNWKARLGADVLFQLAGKTRVRVVPNVHLSGRVTEHSSLYATIRGGFDHNTYLDMLDESRYVSPDLIVKPSFSLVDIEVGAKIGEAAGFRFDIFGGFKQTDDEHLLILNHQVYDDALTTPYPFNVVENLMPVYGSLSHSHIGGMIQSNGWAPLDIALRVKKNFYTVKDLTIHGALIGDARAYNKPGFEADVRGTFEATDDLKFTLNFYFAGDRWSYFHRTDVKMNNINDLNLGAVYEINDAFSINLKANNLLFQKYDIWYGYPAQGFNAMGGFAFKF